MPIFKVSDSDRNVTLIIRARCISCARQVAVDNSPVEELITWRNPSMSNVTVMYHPERQGYEPEGKRALLKRIERDHE